MERLGESQFPSLTSLELYIAKMPGWRRTRGPDSGHVAFGKRFGNALVEVIWRKGVWDRSLTVAILPNHQVHLPDYRKIHWQDIERAIHEVLRANKARHMTAARVRQRYTPRRVAERFVQAKTPVVTVNGKKYVLSKVWGMIGDLVDALGAGKPGGAKVVDTGPARYSWFWAYDPDKRIVAMWRWSDGSEKLHGSAGSYMRDLHKLQELGELNRVTTSEMNGLDRYFRHKEEQTIKELKQIAEENASDFERKVGGMIRDYFKKKIEPKIKAQWAMVENGWRPDGFKVNERLLEFKSEEKQAKNYAASDIFEDDFSLSSIDKFVASEFEGLDFADFDAQMTYFIRHDIIDEFWEKTRGEA